MNKKWILPAVSAICFLAIAGMVLILYFSGGQSRTGEFLPPAFETSAELGIPIVDQNLGWSEIYQDGMEFKAGVCGNVVTDNDTAIVYFTNSDKFDAWLKLRILNKEDEIFGETGLLKPGEYVKSIKLTGKISDGDSIRLKIMAYEPETYYSLGTVTLNTTIREGSAG